MGLQEAVEVVPNPRDPVHDLHQLHVARSAADLRLDQLPPQEAAEEAFDRLHVVDTQHPPGRGGDSQSSINRCSQTSAARRWETPEALYLKLWCSCRLGADDVAWLMVPIIYGLEEQKKPKLP